MSISVLVCLQKVACQLCGRFTLTHPTEAVAALFRYESEDKAAEEFPPRYNIGPTQPIVTIRQEMSRHVMRLVRWGLVPAWVKDPQQFTLLINARAETARVKPSFRGSMRHHRCLVPATGYYEWRREGGQKQPFYMRPKNGELFAMAGLWADWSGPDGNLIDSGALLTQPANEALSGIHHRMPIVLTPDLFDDWLNVSQIDAPEAHRMLKPVPDDFFEAIPVSSRVNHIRNDDADLINRAETDTNIEAPQATSDKQLDLF
ncbi:MAG: SOS response-associated peptidase [Alphaproteobacteria bacterium]|nr:SOS response-associated peptidase [Alphaproteobacteria bacterium]